MNGRALTLPCLLLLAACGDGQDAPMQAQRVSLEEARHVPAEPLSSPDTKRAAWTVSPNGQAIHFGNAGQPPMLSLECRLRENPVGLRIIRHVGAQPGQKALFPVIGNGRISRFGVDAALRDGEWRWEGALPASDPALDVFLGLREIEATLPGGGSLMIDGSRIPGEFVNWCRAGGRTQRVQTAEDPKPAATPSSAPPAR